VTPTAKRALDALDAEAREVELAALRIAAGDPVDEPVKRLRVAASQIRLMANRIRLKAQQRVKE